MPCVLIDLKTRTRRELPPITEAQVANPIVVLSSRMAQRRDDWFEREMAEAIVRVFGAQRNTDKPSDSE